MYDIPIETKKQAKDYRHFRKRLLELGGYQLQESVYLIHLNEKKQAAKIKRELSFSAPKEAHIRSLLITQRVFEKMDLIAGGLTFSEKIVSNRTGIIEI